MRVPCGYPSAKDAGSPMNASKERPPAGQAHPPIPGEGPRHNALTGAVRYLLTSPEVPPAITRRLVPDPFLRQDPQADIRDYAAETPVTPYLPYTEVINWCGEFARGIQPEIEVELLPGDFALAGWGTGDGDAIRDEALAEALRDKPKTFNGPAVRIEDYAVSGGKLKLTVQKAAYFDQRRSNLALDYQYKTRTGAVLTLRDLLRQEFGASLPPLSDRRMANTLGIAALIMVREGDELTPYLVSRSRDVAIFNYGGEWHCTASAVAVLPQDGRSVQYFYKDAMLSQLADEAGLLPEDLDVFAPVAFCREMTRAGKPQMFFLGVTSLDSATLEKKMSGARKAVKAKDGIVENTPMPFLRQPGKIASEEALALFHGKGFTIEAAACLHYFFMCRALGDQSFSQGAT